MGEAGFKERNLKYTQRRSCEDNDVRRAQLLLLGRAKVCTEIVEKVIIVWTSFGKGYQFKSWWLFLCGRPESERCNENKYMACQAIFLKNLQYWSVFFWLDSDYRTQASISISAWVFYPHKNLGNTFRRFFAPLFGLELPQDFSFLQLSSLRLHFQTGERFTSNERIEQIWEWTAFPFVNSERLFKTSAIPEMNSQSPLAVKWNEDVKVWKVT